MEQPTEVKTITLEKFRAIALALFLALGTGGLLTACDDGPAEDAGESIDDTADDVGDAFE